MAEVEIKGIRYSKCRRSVNLCIPREKKEDKLFIEGTGIKKR